MSKHEQKTCPRCGADFECKLNNPMHCQCAGIELSERLTDQLAAHWHDCLCAACLRELAAAERGGSSLNLLRKAVEDTKD